MSKLAQLGATFSLFSLSLLAMFAGGCTQSAPNDAPIVDYIDGPPVVSKASGTYAIPLSIGFHDNDSEVVTHVHYRSGPSVDGIVEIATPIAARQSAEVTVVIPASAFGAGAGSIDRRELSITVIDGRGAESLPLTQVVTLD